MTIIHIVLFKFRADVSQDHKEEFVTELRKLKDLPSVLNSRLVVGGPSVADPIERSQGFQYALLSYHRDMRALEEYQASDEHHKVTNKYLWPFKEDVIRFDFEIDGDDESALLPIQNLVNSGSEA
ncbi:stress responsive A/B barrel domain protein [Nemania sp. NC0429]|nr:stress responsive A/B barrel domain protein [Nemania sp. NC0429]